MSRVGPKDRRLALHGEVERGESVTITVDGELREAHRGETVATVLMAGGTRVFRHTARSGAPRGLYCGMGVCYDCLVIVDGRPNTRVCMTYAREGMAVEIQRGWGVAMPTGRDR